MSSAPSRNLALELVRVTETAALAAAMWVGKGAKNEADQAAVDGMRQMINTVSMDGVIVIGEGEKDAAPMLFNGERVGDGTGIDVLMGIGGTPEGVIAACAMKCVGGEIQGILQARSDAEREVAPRRPLHK